MGVCGLVLVAGLLGFHFTRHVVYGILPPDAEDRVQAARYLAQTGRVGTNIIRPLLTDRFAPNADGTVPDLAHAPLYQYAAAGVMRLAHQTGPNEGHREATLLSLVFFFVSLASCALLSRKLFGTRGMVLAIGLYALSSAVVLRTAVLPHPASLASALFPLLLIAFFSLDTVPAAGDTPRTAPLWWAAVAGAVFGLLFLTAYSTLILLPLLLWHLWRVGGQEKISVVFAFFAVWLLLCGPFFLWNVRLTRNPIYNARLFELIMHTETYPGDSLYRAADLPQTAVRYLASGGIGDLARKTGGNLLSAATQLPAVVGVFVFPLFLGAGLTRFADARVNRLRNLVYGLLLCHVVGLSLFFPADEFAPLLILYAPFAAAIGTAFFIAIVQARNVPGFYGRLMVNGGVIMACLPGLMVTLADPRPRGTTYGVFYRLNGELPEMDFLRVHKSAILVSDAPEDAAFITGFPVSVLPADSLGVTATETRLQKIIGGIVLTPDLGHRSASEAARPDKVSTKAWASLYRSITALSEIANGLDAPTRRSVVQQRRVFYPIPISAAMRQFPRPSPVPERGNTETSLIFWNPQALDSGMLLEGEPSN